MLKFHPMKAEDLETLDWSVQELALCMPADFDPAAAVQAGDLVLTLFDEDRLIGALELKQEPLNGKPVCAVVGTAAVLPAYRRHGLGRMLTALAASAAAERGIWFLAAKVPETAEAQGFAAAMHFRQTDWYDGYLLLDLSDVEGMRHG